MATDIGRKAFASKPLPRLGDTARSQPKSPSTRAWDILLWVSATGFLIIGGWTIWQKLGDVAAGVFGG